MMYVYVLRSLVDGYSYVGMTKNLEKRLKEHNGGLSRSTKGHRPYEIIYKEVLGSYKEAYHREKYLKTGKGRQELKEILVKY